jgi:exo-beta-1,3-glucanase (GH17 family)
LKHRPDTQESYSKDIGAIREYAPKYSSQVYAVIVGAETLEDGRLTAQELTGRIQAVQKTLNGQFKVGTSDSWNAYANGTADIIIQNRPDILYVY